MLFFGWQGIYSFLIVSVIVCLIVMFFAKRLNRQAQEFESEIKPQLDHDYNELRSI